MKGTYMINTGSKNNNNRKTLKDTLGSEKLSDDLRMNVVNIRTLMENTSDLSVKYAEAGGQSICILYCDGMISQETAANLIFQPLNNLQKVADAPMLADIMKNKLLIALEQHQVDTYKELCLKIMSGFIVFLIEGVDYGLAIGAQGYNSRSVEQVTSHINLRSAKEGFNEVIRTNVSLLRRRIKSPTFVFNMITLGDRSNTDVCVCHLSDKASPDLVQSIVKKLKEIDINTVLEGGFIQPFLESKNNRVFTEIGITERPDTLAAKLYEGKVAVLVDGTPFAMYLPRLFVEHFQTMDDYTGFPVYVTLMRYFKYLAFFLTTMLSGLYMALANFNPELFPNSLLFNLLVSEQSTPFPLLLECIIIHILYEIMREAGLRLPTYVGHVVSIVGGLVIGQIVVSAGLVGAPVVLIVAISSITGFIIPDLNDSVVVIRFLFILAGGLWGLYGFTLLGMAVVIRLMSMSNHGVPFMAPLSPFTFKAMRDVLTRVGWRKLVKDDVGLNDLNGVNITQED